MARDPWLDNTKMALVTIVVIGHSLALVAETRLTSQVYDFVYAWHIPAFVLISGYLSRGYRRLTRKNLLALVTTLLVPYVVFSWLLVTFRVEWGGEAPMHDIFLNPHWPMWYLTSMIMWRLVTPLVSLHWLMVPASIAVGLWFNNTGTETLDLNRTVGLLPFFVAGLHLTPALVDGLRRGRWRLWAIAAFAVLFWLSGHTDDWGRTEWLYYRSSFQDLHASMGEATINRLRVLAYGFLGTFAVLSLIPRRQSWFTVMGGASLVVYLFHGFVVREAMYLGYEDWAKGTDSSWTLVPTIMAAVAVALFLAWPPVANRLVWLADPWGSWQAHRRRSAPSA